MMLAFLKHYRMRAFGVVVLASTLWIIFSLFRLQVIHHQKYVDLAYKHQVKTKVIAPKRGQIYILDHQTPKPLVMNELVYDLFADPMMVKNKSAVIEAVQKYASTKAVTDYASKLDKVASRYEILARALSQTEAEAIKKLAIYGLGFQRVNKRNYPESGLASQVLGFVNAEGGQYGVEGYLNKALTGEAGVLESVTDVSEVPLMIGDRHVHIPAKDGDNLVLTLDRNIQYFVEKAAQRAAERSQADQISVVVLNPNNGSVLAMANLPNYQPSEFYKISDTSVFNNTVVDGPYEAGSVIKVFTVAMGLNEGKITPQTTFYNTDSVKVGDRVISNALKGKTGHITMQTALQYSLNTGMVEILNRIGGGSIDAAARQTMYDYFYKRFRLARSTGVELFEAPGVIIKPNQADGNAVRYSNMSFGQGMNVTMLQTAAAFSAVINGGQYYQPTIIAGKLQAGQLLLQAPEVLDQQVVKPSVSQQMRQMLTFARGDFFGRHDKPGYEIGGKTGTSETLVDGKYDKNQTIASYIGYGGTNRPEYVIMVRLSGKGKNLAGNIDAEPIFREISNWLLDYLKIAPKG